MRLRRVRELLPPHQFRGRSSPWRHVQAWRPSLPMLSVWIVFLVVACYNNPLQKNTLEKTPGHPYVHHLLGPSLPTFWYIGHLPTLFVLSVTRKCGYVRDDAFMIFAQVYFLSAGLGRWSLVGRAPARLDLSRPVPSAPVSQPQESWANF